MTSTLPEAERNVWKDAYALHEKYWDMAGTDTDWCKMANTITLTAAKYAGKDERRLYQLLALALYDYLGERQKEREAAAREAPEQVTMEMIPWT